MFAGLFSLIVNLLLISAASAITDSPLLPSRPLEALALMLIALPFFLGAVYLQTRRDPFHWISKERLLLIINIELALFFTFFFFFIGAQRVIIGSFAPFGQTVFVLTALVIYFATLHLATYWSESRWGGFKKAWVEASCSTRFLIPFALPFLFIVCAADISALIPSGMLERFVPPPLETVFYTILSVLSIIALLLVHPHLAVRIWRSPPLSDPALEEKLSRISKNAGFPYTAFREWPVKNRSLTAAIIGIAGCSRYILFSPKLLEISSPEAVGAILAHEIGHWRHRHLLLYPLILLEMGALSYLAATLLFNFIENAFGISMSTATPIVHALLQASSFLFLICVMGLYFRVVFGYFSRLFERQADVFPIELGIPVSHMIEALDTLAVAAGNIHLLPNWHHHSIQERIDFLKEIQNDPKLIALHHKQVTLSLIAFFLALAATLYAIILL